MKDENRITLVIGLGEIGKPLRSILSKSSSIRTIGVDLAPVEIDEKGGIMNVCYPFQLEQGFVQTTAEYARKYSPSIIVINSTVTPGTSARIQEVTGIPTVYSPVRGKHAKMESELLMYKKFVAGSDSSAVQTVSELFRDCGMKVQVMTSSSALELAKLLETTYFGLLIAWAQDMERMCEKVNGDYFDVCSFFEEISYLPPFVFQPGVIGGHCVMPNIALLRQQYQSLFLSAIEESNRQKASALRIPDPKKVVRIEPIRIARKAD